jgi:hypothetical protein
MSKHVPALLFLCIPFFPMLLYENVFLSFSSFLYIMFL